MSFLSFFHLNTPLEPWRGATLDSSPVLFCPYHGLLLEGLLSSVYLKFYLVLDVGLWGGNSILVIFFLSRMSPTLRRLWWLRLSQYLKCNQSDYQIYPLFSFYCWWKEAVRSFQLTLFGYLIACSIQCSSVWLGTVDIAGLCPWKGIRLGSRSTCVAFCYRLSYIMIYKPFFHWPVLQTAISSR